MEQLDEDADWEDAATRPALAPGDQVAWSVLVAGTWLEGTPWPGWDGVGPELPIARRLA